MDLSKNSVPVKEYRNNYKQGGVAVRIKTDQIGTDLYISHKETPLILRFINKTTGDVTEDYLTPIFPSARAFNKSDAQNLILDREKLQGVYDYEEVEL